MKYADKLTDEELKELYRLFTDSDATVKDIIIIRDDTSICLEGIIELPEFDEELLREDPNATIQADDDYEISDYDVKVYHHSGDCTLDYRTWMYKKFGNEYAKDYLFS